MATQFGDAVGGGLDRLVRWVIVPVTGIIPVLVRSGLLFLGFAALWLGFFAALVADPATLDAAWRTITDLPLVVQAVAWLLFLPLTAGLWIWTADWPLVVRVALVVAIAGWNLLVFIPRREAAAAAGNQEARLVDTFVATLVDGIVVPLIATITAPIPFLASSGVLLLAFAALWAAFAVVLVRDPARIEAAWRRLRALPLVAQAIAWLLLLPVLAGAWIWRAPGSGGRAGHVLRGSPWLARWRAGTC